MIIVFGIVQFFSKVIRRHWRKERGLFFGIAGLTYLILSAVFMSRGSRGQGQLVLINQFFHLFVFIFFLGLSIWIYRQTSTSGSRSSILWIRGLSLLWTGYAFFMLTIRFLRGMNHIDEVGEMFWLSLLTFCFTLLHLLRIRILLRALLAGEDSADMEERLYRQYGIIGREREIIRLICMGKTNSEIADSLFLATSTVRDLCSKLYKKMGVRNRTQLAAKFRMHSNQE